MSRSMRRGIFFDLDGTLADSDGVMRRVFRDFAAGFGREVREAEFQALRGPPVAILVAQLKRDWALPQKPAELLQRYNHMIDAAFLDIPPAPGAAGTLEAAAHHGWKVGVVTSNAGVRSRAWL